MDLDSIATRHFNIPYVRPFQRLVIESIAEHESCEGGRHAVLVILPTGSGKSLCFMLPSLFVEGLVVVVYPLLALMEDQRLRFEKAGIRCVVLKGGQTHRERQKIFQELDSGCKVVITNAETLHGPSVLAQLGRKSISLFVIDEAHTVINWGEGFRPKLTGLGSITEHLSISQLLLFTATADEKIIAGLRRIFGKFNIIQGSSDRANISYHTVKTLSKKRAISTLLHLPESRPALVFCPTRASCEEMQAHYQTQNPTIPSARYHAGLTKNQRNHLERWFISNPASVLFSTNAFGMGVDKKDIRTVIHLSLPTDVLSYLQESGRGGRDGRVCHAVVLMDKPDSTQIGRIFWTAERCYRKSLLAILGEEIEYCSGCDRCDGQQNYLREGEQPIIAAVREKPFAFTVSSLVHLLITDCPFDRLSGHLSAWHPTEIREAIQLLIVEKKLIQWRLGGRLCLAPFQRAR